MAIIDEVAGAMVEAVLATPGSVKKATRFSDGAAPNTADLVELVSVLEGKFGIEIPDTTLQKLRTVGLVVVVIEAEQAEPGSGEGAVDTAIRAR